MRIMKLKWSKFQDSRCLRILVICILAIAIGVATGWVSTQGVVIKSFFVGVVALFTSFLFLQIRSVKIFALQKFLLYLTIVAGFIGSAFLAIPVGPIHIFPYRVLLPTLWFILAIQIATNQGKLAISHIKVKPYLQFLGIWLLYSILSLAWAADKVAALRHIIFLFMAISVIFFVVYYFSNSKDLKRFYYLWLLILAALILIGLWENVTGHHLNNVSGLAVLSSRYSAAKYVYLHHMPTTVFRNPNDFATYLVLSIPFMLAFIRYRRSIFARFVGLSMLFASLYLLLVTYSRANYLAVIIEVVFLFTFLFRLKTKFKASILSVLIVLALFVAFPGPTHRVTGTIGEQIESITSSWELTYGSTGVRINLIKNSMVFLGRTAGFGVGAGNAEYWMENFPVYNTYGILNPHNWWDEILVDYGVFIFVGYVLFYLGLIAQLYKIHRYLSPGTEKMICEALLLSLVGFFLASISSSSIMTLRPQWFLFAFALAFLNYQRIKRLEAVT